MTNWLKNLRAKLSGRLRPLPIQTRKPEAKRRLLLECLEDRVTPSTLSLSSGTLTYQAASSETNNLTVSYSSATQKYTFADTGANITCSISGATGSGTHTVSVSAASVSAVSIDLSANSNNDTANIESNNAATTVKTGAGMNTVNVSSNGSTLTGNLAGIADPLTVTSTNGGSVGLVMSNFSATTGDSNVVVGASTITGFGPSTINYNTASGGSFNMVRLIGSNSPSLAEQFTINDPNASTFQLDSEAGGDTAIIEGTNSGSTNNINMGAGAATVTVSSNGQSTGSLDNILGTLNINEGSGSGKTLNLIDYGSSTSKSVTVSGTAVTGFAPATINYKAVGGTFSNITLSGSNTRSDTFTVTASSPAMNLEANGGGDTFLLENNATLKSIAGGAGTDTLTYGSGYTNAVSVALTGSTTSGFSGSATGITNGFTGIDVLNGTGSSTLTGENTASTWTVAAAVSGLSTYADPSESLTFSGFSTLDGGTAADTFNLSSGATGYTISGGGASSGTDTLTGVTNAVLTGSSSTGFSGTANGGAAPTGISFSEIDTLDGSGSLTGDSGSGTTWTVNASTANSTYADPSNSLTFSGFSTLDGGSGGSTFNLQSGASGYTINGYSDDTLTGVSDAVLDTSSSTGFSGTAASSITFSNIRTLDGSGSLTGDSGLSTWTINAIGSNSTYNDSSHSLTFSGFSTLDGGSGGSTFNLQSGASGYTINGYSDDTLTGVSDAVLDNSSGTGFSGTAASSITFSNIRTLDGSGSLTGDSGASTWTINAIASNSTYNDSSESLSFSGFSTLDGGSGGNTFNLQSGASSYTINGYSDDTLTGVSNAVLYGSSASGFSGSAASSISFSNIGTLDGSGSLTGENTTNTWTIVGLSGNTYYDSSYSLSFSGFDSVFGGTGADTFNVTGDLGSIDGGGTTPGPDTYNVATATVTGAGTYHGVKGSDGFGNSFNDIDVLNTNTTVTGSGDWAYNAPGFLGQWELNGTAIGNPTTLQGTGTSQNLFDILGNTTTNIDAGGTNAGGSPIITISNGDTLTGTIDGQDGTATLNYNGGGWTGDAVAWASPVNVTLTTSTPTDGYQGTATGISAGFNGVNTIIGSASSPGSLTGDSGASTWTINAIGSNSTYHDSSESLTFSGFSTLDGGSGGSTFNLQSGASGYTINGYSDDTLTGVSNAVLSSSATTGFSGSAASSISFTNIGTLDGTGSGTLTNGQGVSVTWTLGTPDTYYDGTATLDFTGFSTLAGSGTDTLDGVGSATITGDSTGFSGSTTGPAVNFSGMTTLGGTGTGTLTNGEDVGVTWTLGTPDTYYDGTATLDFTGFGTLAGGGSDTLDGVGSATITGDSTGFSGSTTGPAVNFSGMTTLGGTGTGTLTNGEDVGVTWTLGTPDTYYDGTATLDFTGFGTLAGGGSDTLDGVGSATITGDSTGFSGSTTGPAVNFSGMTTLGGTGTGTLTNGEDVGVTWTLGTPDTYYDGTATLDFTGFGTLAGGGSDTLDGVGSATITGDSTGFSGSTTGPAVNFSGMTTLGGTGTGTLTNGEDVGVTWTLGTPDTYYDGTATLDFTGFSTLAGSGTDTLDGVGSATITGDSTGFSGSTTGPAVNFSGMTTLGGTGTGTLTNGEDVGVTWTLGTPDTYYDGTATLDFTGFGTLAGGGSDTLDGVGSATITGDSTGFSGSTTGPAVNFSGMTTLGGTGTGTLTNGEDVGVTWTLGTPDTYYDGTATLDFTGFGTLAGGGSDTLDGVGSATITGDSTGFSGSTTGPAVNFSGMTTLGGTGTGTLTGENTASTWTVSGTPSYFDGTNTLNFSGFSTLQAGETAAGTGDTFNVSVGGYTIDGAAATDTLTFTAAYGNANVTLSGSSANGYNGSESVSGTTFNAIDQLFADPSNTNSLTGENASTNPNWDLAATQTYNDESGADASDLTFGNFQTLNGGTGGDTFNVTETTAVFPLTLNGNGGFNDVFNVGFNGTTDPGDVNLTGSLAGVQNTLTINGTGATLNVSDAGDTSAIALTVTATDIQSSNAGDIIYNGPSAITIIAGDPATNRNAIDVEGAVSGTTLVLQTTGNSDVQVAQVGRDFDSAFEGVNIILTGTPSDTLTINDQADSLSTAYTVSGTSVFSTNASVSIFSPVGQLVVYGGTGGNTFDVTPSLFTTISVDGGSGSNTLNYYSQPGEAPVNDGSYSITDTNNIYQPVYYYDFASESIM